MADVVSNRRASRRLALSRAELEAKPWSRPGHEIALTIQNAKRALEEGVREVRSRFTVVPTTGSYR